MEIRLGGLIMKTFSYKVNKLEGVIDFIYISEVSANYIRSLCDEAYKKFEELYRQFGIYDELPFYIIEHCKNNGVNLEIDSFEYTHDDKLFAVPTDENAVIYDTVIYDKTADNSSADTEAQNFLQYINSHISNGYTVRRKKILYLINGKKRYFAYLIKKE